ncbi:hypothetical protein PVAND_006773 [Polypedilum vanderplanki]|uniref:FHA domain-containing protein n=1 Tax=Polypedilum vanderplanki TaxID=319348 RepID=A0A9J6C5W1_POLVA|nr:hypothetical protein PVAND_006773 [Polypedilum vanderplanki]
MVIIKRDDYISFLNPTGVKMLTTPVPNELSIQSTGSNGNLVTANNNSGSNTSISTIKRDSSQQQLQQLQQYTQQQNQQTQSVTNQQYAKAQLICRPNSHPFPSRTLLLEPVKPVKIGRAIARTKVSDNNAIFDCKVLSRNHAELWYDDGKFFLKDTGSSNGTFINNQRLSQTCTQSEPFEVSSGDIVQFGVDVMENSRKETHGCIVATLKLYLPDGRETKASQSTLVGGTNTKIPQVDLYRLNQFIQEAVQREQNLESKLLNIQKKIDLVRKSSSASWQALVDEDRLLSRIDMLEKKLLHFSKPLSEDKLREEIMKLHNEKMQYQTSAKQALKKVYNERMEAIQKLSVVEKALCSTEDECSLLRDQIKKTQNQSRETNERLDAMQNQMDIKVSDYEEKIFTKETELKNLNSELNALQDKLTNYKRQNDIGDFESSQLLTGWLLKSDIKNIEGSDDIIKAICEEEDDDEVNLAKSLETNCSRVYNKMLTLEKELNLLFAATNNNIINNNNSNENNNGSDNNNLTLNQSESTETLLELKPENNVPSDLENKSKEEIILLAPNQEDAPKNLQCDDNQNVNNRMLLMQNFNINAAGERIIVNLKQLLALYAKLKRQLMEFTELKTNEHSSYKAKCEEMSSQIMSLKVELDGRPTQQDMDVKIKQCNDLRTELTSLTEQMACNEKLLEQLQFELNEERKQHINMVEKCLNECGIQTDEIKIVSTNKVPDESDLQQQQHIDHRSVLSESPSQTDEKSGSIVKIKTEKQDDIEESQISLTKLPQELKLKDVTDSVIDHETNDCVDDDELNNHPKVLYEDELILFKEKYEGLTNDNIRLQHEISVLRANMNHFHTNWLHNFMLKYLVPVLIIFLAYIFYLLK